MNSSANNLLAFLAISLPSQPASFLLHPSGRWNSRPSLTGGLHSALNVNSPPLCRNVHRNPPVFRPTPTFPLAQQAGLPATVGYRLTAVNSPLAASLIRDNLTTSCTHDTNCLGLVRPLVCLAAGHQALVTFVSTASVAVSHTLDLLDPNLPDWYGIRYVHGMVMQDRRTYLTIAPVPLAQRFRLPFRPAQTRPYHRTFSPQQLTINSTP